VVVDIGIPQRQSEHALAQQGRQTVITAGLPSRVAQGPGHRIHQPDPAIHGSQQQCPGVRGDLSTTELGLDLTPLDSPKLRRVTLQLAIRQPLSPPSGRARHRQDVGRLRVKLAA